MKILIAIATLYFIVYILVHGMEYASLYHPSSISQHSLAFPILFQEYSVKTQDGERIDFWWYPHPEAEYAILLCHGNAGNNSHRWDQIRALYDRCFSVAIFDYRGYGRSTGHPSEKGLYRDGEAVVRFMNDSLKIPSERIAVIGTSLGGAVAVELALRFPFRAVILESAFTSKHAMAKKIFPFFPICLFSRDQYHNLKKISALKSPLLIVHGTEDETVPFSMSLELVQAASGIAFHYPVQGAHHNDLLSVGGPVYLGQIRQFILHHSIM